MGNKIKNAGLLVRFLFCLAALAAAFCIVGLVNVFVWHLPFVTMTMPYAISHCIVVALGFLSKGSIEN